MVLGKHGYETVVRGKNVCMVQRSWAAGFDDPEFWNPKLRSPICFNPPGARSYLPLILKKADLTLASSPDVFHSAHGPVGLGCGIAGITDPWV